MQRIDTDVLIVGAGPAGIVLALELKKRGLNVLLVEKAKSPQRLFKGEFLQPYTVQRMQLAGFDALEVPHSKIRQLRFRDLDSSNRVLSEICLKYPDERFALSMSHYDLIVAMRSKARSCLHDSFIEGGEVKPVGDIDFSRSDSATEFQLKHDGKESRVHAKWVIGCDGRNSSVRRWMNNIASSQNRTPVIGSEPEYIVGVELHQSSPKAEQYEVLRSHSEGTLSAFSINSTSQRIYWSALKKNEKSSESPAQAWSREVANVMTKLQPLQDFGIGPKSVETFPISVASAESAWLGPAARGRFLLVGDAAAVTTPFGGQGMTCAMRHVQILMSTIDWQNSSAKVLQHCTEAYNRHVYATYAHFGVVNHGLYYLFFARNPQLKAFTHHVINAWHRDPSRGARVMSLFSGLDQNTPHFSELLHLWGLLKWQPRILPRVPVHKSLAWIERQLA